MKILYIVSRPLEINSSASIRNINTINGLAQEGYEVDVLTSEYDKNHSRYSPIKLHENVNIKYLSIGGIKKLATATYKMKLLKKVKIVIYNLLKKNEVYDNLKCIIKNIPNLHLEKQYDLVISSGDPKSSHLFTYELFNQKKLINVPWIQIWGDPFLNDITRSNRMLSKKIMKEENKLLSYADKIVYLSELTVKDQQRIYPKYKEKMKFMPRPYQNEVIYKNKDISNINELSISYCGDYNSNVRNILPLYNAINETNHKLVICGSSDIKLKENENIKIKGRVSYEEVLEYESESDILIHLSNLNGTQVPGKIYHYSSTNKPIIFILDGDESDIKEVFSKYNRYEFCRNEKNEIIQAINRVKNYNSKVINKPIQEFKSQNVIKNLVYLECNNNCYNKN